MMATKKISAMTNPTANLISPRAKPSSYFHVPGRELFRKNSQICCALFGVHLRLAVSGDGLLIRRSLVRAQVEEPLKAAWLLDPLLFNR